jgi:serine/threonine protein kinase
LFSKSKPWNGFDDNQILTSLISKRKFEIPKSITDIDVILLIESCLKINPFERADIKQIKKALLKMLYRRINEEALRKAFSNISNSKQSTFIIN